MADRIFMVPLPNGTLVPCAVPELLADVDAFWPEWDALAVGYIVYGRQVSDGQTLLIGWIPGQPEGTEAEQSHAPEA